MLDKDGMPQTEEVEVKIPTFRAVSVFDVKQTSGEPIPELEAKELLSTVEGYEDFIKAITYVAPVPVSFEDIPGDSKGFFSPTEKWIAVQEAKDRNTKEVEAESIAYTVCQHFGIDTSEYSFGYIAGWSSGRDMKELKSSLDTIRKTASELITGIEGQLRELRRDRELMQEQEKESLLLIQNSDLSEYSLVNVRGMDAAELVEARSAMNDNDRLSTAAYLESTRDMAMWFADIASDGTAPEERKRAMEFLGKLVEYKPLAKIEEMEEQNYNMVDNVLNNGAGEKAQKEENKKAQDRPAAKPSLKARLAEKKAQVAGQGREQEENIKNKQREM